MRHLFLAPLASAFGELIQGLRLARDLVAAGDEVVVLAPARFHGLIATAPVTFGRIDLALPRLDRELPRLLERLRCDTLVLVDLAAVGKAVGTLGLDPAAFTYAPVPIVALDLWELPREPVPWDYGPRTEVLHADFHALARRLVPVPLARPDAEGSYAALPPVVTLPPAARAALRGELGLEDEDLLVFLPTSTWQDAAAQTDPRLASLAAALPGLALGALARLGPRARLLHLGPSPFPGGAAVAGYRHLPQVEPARFEALVAAADLVVSFNAVATTLATAVAARRPVVLGGTTLSARTPDEAFRALGERATPEARAFALAHLPLAPLRAWPLSLARMVARLALENPFYSAVREADVLDAAGFAAACRALLFDEDARTEQRRAQDAYVATVQALPAAATRFAAVRGR